MPVVHWRRDDVRRVRQGLMLALAIYPLDALGMLAVAFTGWLALRAWQEVRRDRWREDTLIYAGFQTIMAAGATVLLCILLAATFHAL
jgi:hypothetical protein